MITEFLRRYRKTFALAFSVLVTVLIFVFRASFLGLQDYGLFGLFILSVIGNATVILPVPVFLSAFIGGAVFNPLLVAVVVSLGATIGELTGYFAGYGVENLLKRDLKLQWVKRWMDKFGLWVLFILAAIPNPFFDLGGMVAGANEIPIYKYMIVVWLGKFIKFATLAYLGANSITFLDKFI